MVLGVTAFCVCVSLFVFLREAPAPISHRAYSIEQLISRPPIYALTNTAVGVCVFVFDCLFVFLREVPVPISHSAYSIEQSISCPPIYALTYTVAYWGASF